MQVEASQSLRPGTEYLLELAGWRSSGTRHPIAGWRSRLSRLPHKQEIVGANPTPATRAILLIGPLGVGEVMPLAEVVTSLDYSGRLPDSRHYCLYHAELKPPV